MSDQYRNKYRKYKEKYLRLKAGASTPSYTLKYFEDGAEQAQFITENRERILDLFVECFPENRPQGSAVGKSTDSSYRELLWEETISPGIGRADQCSMERDRWFFALQDTLIVGVCKLGHATARRIDVPLARQLLGPDFGPHRPFSNVVSESTLTAIPQLEEKVETETRSRDKWFENKVRGEILFIKDLLHEIRVMDTIATNDMVRPTKEEMTYLHDYLAQKEELLRVRSRYKWSPTAVELLRGESNKLYPVVESLCKDPTYKGVGSFLLDAVRQVVPNGPIYLIPESTYHKDNHAYFKGEDRCSFRDPVKYLDSNQRLVSYYTSQGFEVSDDLFVVEFCGEREEKFILFPVMSSPVATRPTSRHIPQPPATFKFFDNVEEQVKFIKRNLDQIADVFSSCYPDKNPHYPDIIRHHILDHRRDRWHFVIEDKTVVGFCIISSRPVSIVHIEGDLRLLATRVFPRGVPVYEEIPDQHFPPSDNDLFLQAWIRVNERIFNDSDRAYEAFDAGILKATGTLTFPEYYPPSVYDAVFRSNEEIFPVITVVCMRRSVEGGEDLGKILLEGVTDRMRREKRPVLYVIPESGEFKANAENFTGHTHCAIHDADGYKRSHQQLVEYYKTLGFEVLTDRYAECYEGLGAEFFLSRVMSKQVC